MKTFFFSFEMLLIASDAEELDPAMTSSTLSWSHHWRALLAAMSALFW